MVAMRELDEWLSTYDAAKVAGFHPDHVRRLVRAKQLEARKWGNAWMIRRKSLFRYITAARRRGKKRGPKSFTDQ